MIKRNVARLAAVTGAAGLALAFATPAFAAPGQGNGLDTQPFNCDGMGATSITTVPNGGVPGFIDGSVYVLTHITVTMGDTVIHDKTYGHRNGAGAPITCTQNDGPVTVTVVAVPVGQAAR